MDVIEEWHGILTDLVDRSKSPRLSKRRISLKIRPGRWWPLWLPYIWLIPLQNTFTIGRLIVIGRGLDALPVGGKRYIIAHELGHIAWRHGAKATAGLAIIAVSLVINVPLVSLAMFVFGVCMVMLTRHYAEYQADRFAVRLIGPDAVLEGMREIDEHLKRRPSALRKNRMAALQKMTIHKRMEID